MTLDEATLTEPTPDTTKHASSDPHANVRCDRRTDEGEAKDVTDSTRCRHRPSDLRSFLRLVEPTDDHLALGALADMLRRVLEVLREEGETCGAFDGVDCVFGAVSANCWEKKRRRKENKKRRTGAYLA